MMNLIMKRTVSPWFVYREIGQLGFIIAIPLVAMVLGGHWLDQILGYQAAFILIAIPISMIISGYIIYKKIKSIE